MNVCVEFNREVWVGDISFRSYDFEMLYKVIGAVEVIGKGYWMIRKRGVVIFWFSYILFLVLLFLIVGDGRIYVIDIEF